MEFIEWNENLSVGVTKLDDEHKNLVDFINKLNHALQISGARSTMEDILTGLIKYTVIHFTHEEEMMKIHDYPNFTVHKQEHEKLTAKVTEFNERLHEGKAAFSLELMQFLKNWLIDHIQGTDKLYSPFFNGKGIR